MHWSFVDPAEAKGSEEARLNIFEQVRDAIGARIKEFLHHVAPE
jgi:arsenate reductase